jgi:hypothetical protein
LEFSDFTVARKIFTCCLERGEQADEEEPRPSFRYLRPFAFHNGNQFVVEIMGEFDDSYQRVGLPCES